jgi:hypothetical protein
MGTLAINYFTHEDTAAEQATPVGVSPTQTKRARPKKDWRHEKQS